MALTPAPHHKRKPTVITEELSRRVMYYVNYSDELSKIQIAKMFNISLSALSSIERRYHEAKSSKQEENTPQPI